MKRGLVFGKFLPFHKGHKALIGYALKQCDELIVLVCCSDKEHISSKIRVNWIKETFQKNRHVIVQAFDYKEAELPNASESSRIVSQIWASKFREILPYFDVLITSEKYGEYLAEHLEIPHILFDENRKKHAISSSMIRQNPSNHWHYITDAAKPYFQKKVVLLGTESVGKSTLCNTLARYFDANLVSEVGCEVVQDLANFTKSDLESVIEQHCQKIKKAKKNAQPLMILDTDIHTTQSYAKYAFGEYLDVSPKTYKLHRANLYLFLNNDVPFVVQDGKQMSEKMRNELDKAHRKTLKDFRINYHEINGNWSDRMNKAIKLVEKMIGQ
jgi:HTH-type transcriptional repressor of NAD biosynthesis genes